MHEVDLRDRAATENLIAGGDYAAVVHFAALKAVGDSMARPLEYYDHNMNVTFSLLSAMEAHGPCALVFSSSATVYGDQATFSSTALARPLECPAAACHDSRRRASRRR